jgi:hypothetical protein
MTQYVWAAAFLIGLACGSVVTNWNRNVELAELEKIQAQQSQERAEVHLLQLKDIRTQRDELQARLDQIDTQGYGELSDAKTTVNRLTVELATAQRRLSVRTACPASGTGHLPSTTVSSSVDDGGRTRADIHPEDAAAIVRVTGEADQCRIKLTGLQRWAASLSPEKREFERSPRWSPGASSESSEPVNTGGSVSNVVLAPGTK